MEMLLVELGNSPAAIKDKHAGRAFSGIISTAKYFAPEPIAAFSRDYPRIAPEHAAVGTRTDLSERPSNRLIDGRQVGACQTFLA